jgi:Fe2+ or Zn2+ uptake regulation protein
MNKDNLTKEGLLRMLKEKDKFYLMGKKSETIEAAIDYITSGYYLTQKEVAEKHSISTTSVRKRSKEIAAILNLNLDEIFAHKIRTSRLRHTSKRMGKICICSRCGKITDIPRYNISKRESKYHHPRVVGYLCKDCYNKILGEPS